MRRELAPRCSLGAWGSCSATSRTRPPEPPSRRVSRRRSHARARSTTVGDAQRIIEDGARQLDRLDAEDATLVHGDIKADHLLAGPDGVAVLDTDRCARADPALDLGKLIADLRWWAWATGRPHFGSAETALLAGYGSEGSRVERARLYAALWLVKIAARRVSVAWRDWEQGTAEVLALADVLLSPAESA